MLTRWCRDCKRSLIALEVTGVTHNPKTGRCSDCNVPWAEAELIGYIIQDGDITIEVDTRGNDGRVDMPNSKSGDSSRESSNLSSRTKSIDQMCMEYVLHRY